jgi:hypothetical protein
VPGRGEAGDVPYLGQHQKGSVVAQARHGGKEQRLPLPSGPLPHPPGQRPYLLPEGHKQPQQPRQLPPVGLGQL